MKRVLFVINTPTFGGPHNQALRLAPFLEKRGWTILVLLPDEPGNGAERLQSAGITTLRVPFRRFRRSLNPFTQLAIFGNLVPDIKRIASLIRRHQIDLVQVAGIQSIHGAYAAKAVGVALVWQLLSTYAPPVVRLLLSPFATKLADVVMATGMSVAQAHHGVTDLGNRLVIFYPPVDTSLFRPDPERRRLARRELAVPENGLLVGTVGNFSYQKQHELLARAASIFCTEAPNVYVRILGAQVPTQARYYDLSVKREAEKLGLLEKGRLQFVDPGGRVNELLPAFDVFVLTSRAEGVPTALLEAMSCGLPVVATRVGSVPEVVEEGVTGFLVSPSDHCEVADRVLRLLRSEELRGSMGTEARRRAVQLYDIGVCATIHAQAYEQALQHHRNHAG